MDKTKSIPARPVLGKGLASLLPGAGNKDNSFAVKNPATGLASGFPLPNTSAQGFAGDSQKDRIPGITFINISDIKTNPFQPRKTFVDSSIHELAESIRANGIIQPLIVRRNSDNKFELIAGERRLRAAKEAGLSLVPVVVKRTTDKESLEIAIIENIQREDLNCMETALAYSMLVSEFSLTQEELSKRVGKDRATIANHLRLLKLPSSVQTLLKTGELSYGHGRTLVGLDNPAKIERLAQESIEYNYSVRSLEEKVNHYKASSELKSKSKNNRIDPITARLNSISEALANKYSMKFKIQGTQNKGKLTIEYLSPTDFEKLIAALHRGRDVI